MDKQVSEYIKYLSHLKEIKKPKMPTFSISAYTDSEYRRAIEEIMMDYENVDDMYLTLKYLKGE